MAHVTILLFLMIALTSFPIKGQEESNHYWQRELKKASQQSDYHEMFVTPKNVTIEVRADGCRKFDNRCVWQYARSWIGIALDDLGAKKTPNASVVNCTLTYSVYQENPENVRVRCQNDNEKTIHYTKLGEFLKKELR